MWLPSSSREIFFYIDSKCNFPTPEFCPIPAQFAGHFSSALTGDQSAICYFVTPQRLYAHCCSLFLVTFPSSNSQDKESDYPCSPCFGQSCSHQTPSAAPDNPMRSHPPSNGKASGEQCHPVQNLGV